jgi:hypothetical protein
MVCEDEGRYIPLKYRLLGAKRFFSTKAAKLG